MFIFRMLITYKAFYLFKNRLYNKKWIFAYLLVIIYALNAVILQAITNENEIDYIFTMIWN